MDPKRIAVFLPNWIGDVVMATPAIRHIHATYPKAEIIAICKPYVAGIVGGAPWFTDVILYDRKGKTGLRGVAVASRLRKEKIDVAILFPNSFRTAMVAWFGQCRRRIGFARYARSVLLTDPLEHALLPDGQFKPTPVIDDYNRLAERLTGCQPLHRMELFTTPDDECMATKVSTDLNIEKSPELIGLNPGGAFGSSKHWAVDNFAEVARNFIDLRGSKVLVFCGPAEREMARQIQQKTNRPGAIVTLADAEVSLGLTKAMCRRLDLLVTTDSGPRHIAAAFNRPVVTLFGPTHIAWTETYFPKAIHLQKQVSCGPCQLRVCPTDHRCMTELTSAEVVHAGFKLLKQFPAEGRRSRHAA